MNRRDFVRYVQGGGCASVGVAGLVQSGGFGSFSQNSGLFNRHWGEQIRFHPGRTLTLAMIFQGLEPSEGENYPRLAAIKKRYDPDGLFFVHHGVGSERWSADGFEQFGRE